MSSIRERLEDKRRVQKIQYFERQRIIYLELQKYARDILDSEAFNETKWNTQHGTISVRDHCISVARYSITIARKLHIKCNAEDLIRGALLHDYFLYDWHKADLENPHKLHGFFHPRRALMNASRDYELTDRQKDIIEKHMWPLTVIPPTCKEAWVVTMADKYCSFLETAHMQKGHRAKRRIKIDE